MTAAVETLTRVIEKVERLKSECTPGEWWTTRDLKWPSGFAGTGSSDDVCVMSEARLIADAHLVVTLHRMINAQLDTFRLARAFYGAAITGPESSTAIAELALALAVAVLGEQ